MNFEYLALILIIFFSFYLSHKIFKWTIWPEKKAIFYSIFISAFLFIFSDILVTGYFWDFNPKYILGLKLINLPIEEVLFFFVVPLACMFLYVNLEKVFKRNTKIEMENKYLFYIFQFVLIFINIIFFYKKLWYSGFVFLFFILILFLARFLKVTLFKENYEKLFILLVILLTTIFNFYLTWRPIVVYNSIIKTNFNILTIPFEDYIYGLILIFLNIIIYKKSLYGRK